METLILGWYILVETHSVLLLTLYASLQYLGTLVAPMFGVVGDRIGHRNLLCLMRGGFTVLATILALLAFLGRLDPVAVLAIAAVAGLGRPSDFVMRFALIGVTVTGPQLMSAMSVSRTTSDSSRVIGALTGAGLVASLGMGPACAGIALLYAASLAFSLGVSSRPAAAEAAPALAPTSRRSPWRDLREGVRYVRSEPHLTGTMCLAFLLNLTAFPVALGLLPYVAKEIYGTGQTGLGVLVAAFSCGGLVGSVVLYRSGHLFRPARTMVVCLALWHAVNIVFALAETAAIGIALLFLSGVAQSLCLIPMSAMLMRTSREELRGRVMGIRVLAVYGLPIGLIASSPLITSIGFKAAMVLYGLFGIACILAIAFFWRDHLWRTGAIANRR
jgi:predicted MFS family arabinose efflux permease